MPGTTDVMNLALTHVGATRITSRDDGSASANAVDEVYDEVLEELLRSHNWNFATTRVKLARSSTAPAFEYDYAYPLPADWLRTRSVHHNDAGHSTVEYRMELINGQRAIVASSDDIYLRYVKLITDPNLMTADFRTALAYHLAKPLAIKLASSSTLRDEMKDEATRHTAKARSSDSQDQFPERRPRGSWATARGGRRRDHYLHD